MNDPVRDTFDLPASYDNWKTTEPEPAEIDDDPDEDAPDDHEQWEREAEWEREMEDHR